MKRSLFVRVLLWLLLTAAVSVALVLVVGAITEQPSASNLLVRGLAAAHLEEARHVYERDGRDGLQQFLERVRRAYPPGVRIAGADERDLVTGEDLRPTLRLARTRFTAIDLFGRQALFTRTTEDGRYRIYVPLAPGGPMGRLARPQPLVILLTLIVLCWALARHISRPVVHLQRVVERFGSGDTSARAGTTRSDEIGELARAFDGMADRIEELVQGQRRLLLDISHELRSPLARLTLATDLLRADPRDTDSLDQIDREAERLNALIGEILQSATPDSAEMRRQFVDVRLDELVTRVTDRCRIEAAGGVGLSLSLAAVTVVGSEDLLERAVENVLRNALRYAPPATSVDVSLAEADGAARLTIRDRGPGVPEAALPHLFTPFYRCQPDRDRQTGGVGLGLAIARRAIAQHGGQISARNAGPGLIVDIVLGQRAR